MDYDIILSKRNLVSTDILDLHQEAKRHLENSKAINTKIAYRTDWQQFSEWCRDNGFNDLPADPETIVYYITLLGKKLKASSIKRKMTAISQRHETTKFISPTKTALVQGVWNGLQRHIGIKEVGKDALWLHDLIKIVKGIDTKKKIGIRNHALLVIGWVGAFRRSELVNINVEDIEFTEEGLIIYIGKSKKDQKGLGHTVALPYGSNPLTCPVRTLKKWFEVSKIKDGAIFCSMDRHGNIKTRLTPQSIRLIVKNCCKHVGLDPKRFSAHSLRSGFCSTAAKAGKSEHQIMKQTRHKRSDSLKRYIKHGTLFEDNAASGIGL